MSSAEPFRCFSWGKTKEGLHVGFEFCEPSEQV